MKSFLVFFILFSHQVFYSQSVCTTIDRKFDSIILTGITPKIAHLKQEFFAYKYCVQATDPVLFQKIKYFDFILKGDGSVYVGKINDTYVFLDTTFHVLKTVVPNPGITSTGLEIFPFQTGVAIVNSDTNRIINTKGEFQPNLIGRKIAILKSGYCIQNHENEVSFYNETGKVEKLDAYTFMSFKISRLNSIILYGKNSISLMNENGVLIRERCESIIPNIEATVFTVVSKNGYFEVINDLTETVFKDTFTEKPDIGKFGVLFTNEKGKWFYHFFHKKVYHLKPNQQYEHFKENQLIVKANKRIGFCDLSGNLEYPIQYEPTSDWNYYFVTKENQVFSTKNEYLMLLPCSKDEWKRSKLINTKYWLINGNLNRILNVENATFLPLIFDSIDERWNKTVLFQHSNHSLQYVIYDGFQGHLIIDNGRFLVKDDSLCANLTPIMDTLEFQGFAPYKFQDTLGYWGLIDSNHEIVCPAVYEKASTIGYYQYKVKKDNKTGVIDHQKRTIIPIIYDDVRKIQAHFYLAKLGNNVVLFDCYGERIIDETFNSAEIYWENNQLLIRYIKENEIKTKYIYQY